jgi:predicted PhzF superfamily epimerase YddE/YHI9
MSQRLVQVDAFSSRPFRGNPAGVCLLERPASAEWMQLVAREMNLAETAFLYREGREGREGELFSLRWFTPAVEVALCGHATLASAHVLFEDGHLPPAEVARFSTQSGILSARKDGDWIELDFPATPVGAPRQEVDWAAIVGVAPRFVGESRFDAFVEIDDEGTLSALAPDLGAIARLPYRGVIVTARSSAYDFVSRFFAPGSGVPEDPVTGSAHCALAPYWAGKLGKSELHAFQASPRGGELRVRNAGDRVILAGQAVTVFRIELVV